MDSAAAAPATTGCPTAYLRLLSHHQSRFLLQYTGTNTETNNWTMCRVSVNTKPLPSGLRGKLWKRRLEDITGTASFR